MKPETTHHEILFFTGSSFAGKQFCSREEKDGKTYSNNERLEKACWDGLLNEMFPEILGSFSAKCESFIWHVLNGKNYLYISIGPNPVAAEPESSIDPYYFMMNSIEN